MSALRWLVALWHSAICRACRADYLCLEARDRMRACRAALADHTTLH